jgi:GNAT superfamily N-acetyltransferase
VAPPITTRRATVDDLDVMLQNVQTGFDSYTAFAPAGWKPPDVAAERGTSMAPLGDPGTWALLALDGADPVGHVAFSAGRERRRSDEERGDWRLRPLIPGLAHLWQLFVLPDWWGRGVAPMLHAAAIAEMRARGHERGRLFTPSLHTRARRFYERRGWQAAEDAWNSELGMMVTEYSLALR